MGADLVQEGLPGCARRQRRADRSTRQQQADPGDQLSRRLSIAAITRTALASPLKGAARYLLGKTGDENNVAALGGGDRSGTVKKVIIFETDGQPWRALSHDERNGHASTTTTTSSPTAGLGPPPRPTTGARERAERHARGTSTPAPTDRRTTSRRRTRRPIVVNSHDYTYTYKHRTPHDDDGHTSTNGGQKACQNFKQVANLAKQAGRPDHHDRLQPRRQHHVQRQQTWPPGTVTHRAPGHRGSATSSRRPAGSPATTAPRRRRTRRRRPARRT